jgi:Ser/Thr protein kinase RdoA (MazF antagonist)
MTFWQFVEEDRDKEPDYVANSESVADLHSAMRAYPGRLSFLSAAEPQFITDSIALLEKRPDLVGPSDLDRARREWQVLEPLVRSRSAFERAFPGIEIQPIHGDSPPANVFSGVERNLYSDFELVTSGPVEWDLAGLGSDMEAAYNRGAQRNGMRPLNEDVLRFVNAVGMLRAVSVLALAPQLPVLVEYVMPAVDQWRTMPFAGGVTQSRLR